MSYITVWLIDMTHKSSVVAAASVLVEVVFPACTPLDLATSDIWDTAPALDSYHWGRVTERKLIMAIADFSSVRSQRMDRSYHHSCIRSLSWME